MNSAFISETCNDAEQSRRLDNQHNEAKDKIDLVFEQHKSISAESRKKEPEQKKQKTIDPVKRAYNRFAGSANVMKYQTRASRKQRTKSSRSIPPIKRNSSNQPVQITKKMKHGGYLFPYCINVKVQNIRMNVHQHIHAKHRNSRDPTTQKMQEVAC